MKIKKIFSAVLLGCAIIFASTSISEAYVLEGYKLPSKSSTYKWGSNLDNGSSVIKTGWNAADTAWNLSSNIVFSVNTSSVNTLNSWYEYSSSYYGRMTTSYTTKGIVTKFSGDINSGNTNITKANVAKSTGVHEFGHAIGIDHNSGTSIMNSSRDRTKMHIPQADDKNGVNKIY